MRLLCQLYLIHAAVVDFSMLPRKVESLEREREREREITHTTFNMLSPES